MRISHNWRWLAGTMEAWLRIRTTDSDCLGRVMEAWPDLETRPIAAGSSQKILKYSNGRAD